MDQPTAGASATGWSRRAETHPPRVLVVSNNPFSDVSNNGKTLTSLFEDYPTEALAQLYFSDEAPSGGACRKFFKVSDADVLRRLARRTPRDTGPVWAGPRRSRGDLARLAREAVWATGAWHTPELDNWLDAFDPEVVFFMAGDSLFAFRAVEHVLRRAGASLTLYVTDDYVLPRITISPAWWLRRGLVSKSLGRAVGRATLFVTISEDMRRTYAARYGRSSLVAANSPDALVTDACTGEEQTGCPLVLTYAGGLHFNRATTLASMGRAIHAINEAAGKQVAVLRIFSGQELGRRDAALFDAAGAIEFGGALDASGVARELGRSDVLVHVESFDRRSRESTRLSVSTKIPEYLAHAKPVVAVGPEGVASMNTLSGAALCVTDPARLTSDLRRLLFDSSWRDELAARANHRFEQMQRERPDVMSAMVVAHRTKTKAAGTDTQAVVLDRILMVVGVVPDNVRERVLSRTKGSLVASADVLQRSLIKGFVAARVAPVSIINSMHVGTFPRSSKHIHFRSTPLEVAGVEGFEGRNVGFWNLPIVSSWSRARSIAAAYRVSRVHQGRDLVFVYSLLDWNMAFLSGLARGAGSPVVCLVVTDLPENMVFPGGRLRPLMRAYHKVRLWMMRRVIARGLERVDVFVVLTRHMKARLPTAGRPVLVMEGMVDVDAYDFERNGFANPADGLKRITYTGGLEVELGVGDLLEAFAQISDSDARLVICGDGQLRPLVEQAMRQDPRIVFEGPVSFPQAVRAQLAASVLVCPTRIDGEVSRFAFPAKLLEYLYSGNIVVSRRLEAIPDEYDAHVVYTGDGSVPALAAAIRKGLIDAVRRDADVASRQRAFVREEKSIHAMVGSILDTVRGAA